VDSGTDAVIVEGVSTPTAPTPAEVIKAYNHKYDWDYQVAQHGTSSGWRLPKCWPGGPRAGPAATASTSPVAGNSVMRTDNLAVDVVGFIRILGGVASTT